jgi:geranylgeranylglycerol-phosphate geranylgeranyltransferase
MERKRDYKKENILKKPINFLSNWRPFPLYELLSYVLMYASVPMLAYGIQKYDLEIIKIIFLTITTLYCGFFAALIWNDITDSDIDNIVHPNRPVPSGKISKRNFFKIALVFSAMTFIFAIIISYWCLLLVGLIALFVTFHNKYLKRKIKIPAYSEIFTPIQWITVSIFGFLAVWTVYPQSMNIIFELPILEKISTSNNEIQNMVLLVLFTYFTDNAHDLPEGIHDVDGDKKLGVKTYATSFGVKNAAIISFCMVFISGLFGILLFLRTILSPFFLITFLSLWFYILLKSYKFAKLDNEKIKKMAKIIGRNEFDYLLMSYNLIFLDVFLQLINFHFIII